MGPGPAVLMLGMKAQPHASCRVPWLWPQLRALGFLGASWPQILDQVHSAPCCSALTVPLRPKWEEPAQRFQIVARWVQGRNSLIPLHV